MEQVQIEAITLAAVAVLATMPEEMPPVPTGEMLFRAGLILGLTGALRGCEEQLSAKTTEVLHHTQRAAIALVKIAGVDGEAIMQNAVEQIERWEKNPLTAPPSDN